MNYVVIVEQSDDGYSAFVPDLPGCITVGETLEDIRANIGEAIALYLEGLEEKGLPVPRPTTRSIEVRIPA